MNRRTFLSASAAGAGALGLRLPPNALQTEEPAPGSTTPSGPLKLLILGGTSLTGPHNVRYALERGHSVTIFNRGKTKPGLFQDAFENVEQLTGDREGDLAALKGRTWDAVIDASGKREAWTKASADLLKDAAERYLYISSTGVYYPYLKANLDESVAPALEDPSAGENGSRAYGVMKARSEARAREAFGDERTLVIRPGYIVGPLDRTHRGTYWPLRLRRGGDVLVPGKRTDYVQQIDVRDLTEFMIRALEDKRSGTLNVTGPGATTTMAEFVYGVKGAFTAEVNWNWVDDYAFLEQNRLGYAIPWILPKGDHLGSQRISVEAAKAAGLTFRSLSETALDTLSWFDTLTEAQKSSPPMALTTDREKEILAAWKGR